MVDRAKTLAEMAKQMADAGLPDCSREARVAIIQHMRDQFLDALLAVLRGEDATRDRYEYLDGIVKACSVETCAALKGLGYSLPMSDLIRIGASEGRAFSTMACDAITHSATSGQSLVYIRTVLDSVDADQGMGGFFSSDDVCSLGMPTNEEQGSAIAGRLEGEGGLGMPTSHSRVSAATAAPTERPRSYRVFGGSAAICLNECETRNHEKTVSIDAAAVMTNGAQRVNDWANKISVQLTMPELPVLLAVMECKIDAIEFSGHGASRDKILTVKYQKEKGDWFISVRQGKVARGVPVSAGDGFWIAAMVRRRVKANMPDMDEQCLSQLIGITAQVISDAKKV